VIKAPKDVESRIKVLQAEESAIEDQTTHHGFRDASRRNRIEEQLDELDETMRRDGTKDQL
jgi:hypothetical protein